MSLLLNTGGREIPMGGSFCIASEDMDISSLETLPLLLELFLRYPVGNHRGSGLQALVVSTNYLHVWCQSSLEKV